MSRTDVLKPRHSMTSRRRLHRSVLPILLVLVGVAVLLYPVVATHYNNVKQREFSDRYEAQITRASPDSLARELELARAYNATLNGVPILDPFLDDVANTPGSTAYQDYLETLADFSAMARLRVPSVDIDLPVYHGTSDATIAKGAGHLYGTSLPVGGPNSHAALTSHTGMPNATLFDHLIDVGEGDLLYVDVYGETLVYEVEEIKVVLPTVIDDLHVIEGADLLTLITCTPYAVNTHRLLVTGHRVAPSPDDVGLNNPGTPTVSLEPWMYTPLAVALAALIVSGMVVSREIRRGRP